MIDDSLPFEKVSLEDAKKALDTVGTVPPPKVEERDWRWARKWKPDEPLKEETAKWLLGMPPQLRPIHLPQAYPRIINRLCDLWTEADMCERYFEELLVDRRGRRKGFPEPVQAEIKVLRQLHKKGPEHTVWDAEALRRR